MPISVDLKVNFRSLCKIDFINFISQTKGGKVKKKIS